jgi:D-aminoacyl-tRNA deacylase
VGHVAADWGLDAMGPPDANREVLRRAVEASGTDTVLVAGDHERLRSTLADLGYRTVTETWLRETSAHPLPVVHAVEARLDDVADGLRFGTVVPPVDDDEDAAGAIVVTDLPSPLVDAAHAVDADATRAAVADAAVAFETTEGGTRPRGRVALASDDADGAAAAMTDQLMAVLREAFDDVTRTDGSVVARTSAFDPATARELGVPEGPAFGRLADGESVDVDGDRIDPDAVRTERVERFPVVTVRDPSVS